MPCCARFSKTLVCRSLDRGPSTSKRGGLTKTGRISNERVYIYIHIYIFFSRIRHADVSCSESGSAWDHTTTPYFHPPCASWLPPPPLSHTHTFPPSLSPIPVCDTPALMFMSLLLAFLFLTCSPHTTPHAGLVERGLCGVRHANIDVRGRDPGRALLGTYVPDASTNCVHVAHHRSQGNEKGETQFRVLPLETRFCSPDENPRTRTPPRFCCDDCFPPRFCCGRASRTSSVSDTPHTVVKAIYPHRTAWLVARNP